MPARGKRKRAEEEEEERGNMVQVSTCMQPLRSVASREEGVKRTGHRGSERQTHTQTHTHTQRHRERDTHTETHRDIDTTFSTFLLSLSFFLFLPAAVSTFQLSTPAHLIGDKEGEDAALVRRPEALRGLVDRGHCRKAAVGGQRGGAPCQQRRALLEGERAVREGEQRQQQEGRAQHLQRSKRDDEEKREKDRRQG